MEAYCLPARCHGNTLTLAAEMLQSQLTTVAPQFVRKQLKLPSASPASAPGSFASTRAGSVSDLYVFVHVGASVPCLCTLSWPNMLSATGDGTDVQVFLLREKSFPERFGSKMLLMLILAECSGRVFSHTGCVGGGYREGLYSGSSPRLITSVRVSVNDKLVFVGDFSRRANSRSLCCQTGLRGSVWQKR